MVVVRVRVGRVGRDVGRGRSEGFFFSFLLGFPDSEGGFLVIIHTLPFVHPAF